MSESVSLSELTEKTYESVVGRGVVWRYRQPGTSLAAEISLIHAASVSDESKKRAMKAHKKKPKDFDDEAAMSSFVDEKDIETMMVAQHAARILAFRVCVIGLDGVKNGDGSEYDLAAKRNTKETVGGISMSAIDPEALAELDSGELGEDIAALGEHIVGLCALAGSKKKPSS